MKLRLTGEIGDQFRFPSVLVFSGVGVVGAFREFSRVWVPLLPKTGFFAGSLGASWGKRGMSMLLVFSVVAVICISRNLEAQRVED